jgi:hypothetical protein
MAKVERVHVAAATAFARSRGRALPPDGHVDPVHTRLHPGAIAFVAGFPGVVGAAMLWSAIASDRTTSEGYYVGIVVLVFAALLLVLGLRSFIRIDQDALTVRFYGLRRTTVRLAELESATFLMAFPSISFAFALTDRGGHRHPCVPGADRARRRDGSRHRPDRVAGSRRATSEAADRPSRLVPEGPHLVVRRPACRRLRSRRRSASPSSRAGRAPRSCRRRCTSPARG